MASELTDAERAYFDAIKQVATSARPEDLSLWRMELPAASHDAPVAVDVAVIMQRVLGPDGTEQGWQPLAIIVDDETALRLRSPMGGGPKSIDPDGMEGAA